MITGSGGARYRRVLTATGIGTFVEVYDIVIYGYLATTLAGQFFPHGDQLSALLATYAVFAVGAFVRPLGAVVFGHVGDRYGRRSALALSLLLMTFTTVALGLLPSYAAAGPAAPGLLVLCRAGQALSTGAEIPGAMLLVLEHAPAGRRGRIVSINNVAAPLATVAAVTVSLLLSRLLAPSQLAAWGWRVAFLIAAPIGIVGWYVRTRLLDSPAFVALGEAARQGRAPLIRATRTAKRGMVVLTLWFAAQTIGSYTVSVVMPAQLVRGVGYSPTAAYATNLVAILVSAASVLVGGYLVDRFPLRPVAICLMTAIAATAVPALLVIVEYRTLAAAVVGQTVCAAFLGAAQAVGAVAAVLLFPTGIRFTAFAISAGLGTAVFGSTTPYVSTWLTAHTHSLLAPGFALLAAAGASTLAAAAGLPRRTAGQPHADREAPLRQPADQ